MLHIYQKNKRYCKYGSTMVKPKENKMREITEFKKVQYVNSYFTLFDNYVYYFEFHVCKNILMPTTNSLSK